MQGKIKVRNVMHQKIVGATFNIKLKCMIAD